jgi:methionine-gamma-lyase
VLFGETPANPLMDIMDLEAFGKLGASNPGVITVIDSTFASPHLQQPIKHGIDIVLHSW